MTRKWKETKLNLEVSGTTKPIYCISWSDDLYVGRGGRKFYCFASCCDNKVVIHEVEVGKPNGIYREKQTYIDGDEDEEYLTCTFGGRSILMNNEKGPQLLIVGGRAKLIKVIDTIQNRQIGWLRGHGSDIHDLKVSPRNEELLLSASNDETVRLWNLQSFACVAIFAGQNGHTQGIFSVSWHPEGQKFATAGYDQSVRLWNINNSTISEALQASYGITPAECRVHFRPVVHQFPYFGTSKIHNSYVDCVQWLGDLILSKSTYNQIVMWQPDLANTRHVTAAAYQLPEKVIVLRTFEIDNCNVWFVRFGIDPMGQYMAVGNLSGEVNVWKFDDDDAPKECFQHLKTSKEVTIRMLAFSPDGETLVACSDNASISRWDLVESLD